jgi:hypothetical protein
MLSTIAFRVSRRSFASSSRCPVMPRCFKAPSWPQASRNSCSVASWNWQTWYLSTGKTRHVVVDFAPPPTTSIPVALSSPKTRGRIFIRFSPVALTQAAEKTRQEATRQRTPDDDPFAALFYLFLAQKNWDVRIKGLNALLAAYPENSRHRNLAV